MLRKILRQPRFNALNISEVTLLHLLWTASEQPLFGKERAVKLSRGTCKSELLANDLHLLLNPGHRPQTNLMNLVWRQIQ